ncbi:hypothetical protein [Hymenobacter rubidus]|uniref:hypothetical protein n=1 Tax=Hymenobacter rubidus TaxID=1441626 RepID=UPI00191E7B31|nr:hypothetical protein [Hymenobacter rubidus]
MAASTTPPPSLPIEPEFLPAQLVRFADNEFMNITERSFRDFSGDVDKTFVKLADLTTNLVRGAVFRTPNVVLVGGQPTVDTSLIPPRYRILGMEAMAENGVDAATAATGVRADPVYFKLLPLATGPVQALVDAKATTGTRVWAQWVRTSGTDEQRMSSYPVLPLDDTPLYKGEVYQHTFTDLTPAVTRLFEVKQNISQFATPLPTGLDSDPNYKPFAPLSATSHEQNSDLGTYQPTFTIRLASQERGTGAVRTVLVFEGMNRQAAALSFRAQDADGVRRPAFEMCLAWTGRSADVWVPLGGDSSAAVSQLQAAIDAQTDRLNNLVAGAPEALDTLAEIAAQQAADETGTAAMLATQQQHTQQLAANAGFLGTLSNLLTTAKGSLVAAVNELYGKMGTVKTINGTAPDAAGNVVVASGAAVAIGTGTVIHFDQDRDYQELSSGTFTFDKSVLTPHAVVTALLGTGCTAPVLDGDFEGSGTFTAGQKHRYVFWIAPTATAGKIQYAIIPRA